MIVDQADFIFSGSLMAVGSSPCVALLLASRSAAIRQKSAYLGFTEDFVAMVVPEDDPPPQEARTLPTSTADMTGNMSLFTVGNGNSGPPACIGGPLSFEGRCEADPSGAIVTLARFTEFSPDKPLTTLPGSRSNCHIGRG